MSKYKVGDRVVVYAADIGLFGAKGTVQSLLENGEMAVKLDQPTPQADTPGVYPQQCRKLVKKESRRVWVHESYFEDNPHGNPAIQWAVGQMHLTKFTNKPYGDCWIEFIERKRK